MVIVRTTWNTASGRLHAAMSATVPQSDATLARMACVSSSRAAHHIAFWSKPQPSRGVYEPAYIWKGTGWILAPGVQIVGR